MLHYYFDDKERLLIYCVRLYKEEFVAKMSAVIDTAASPNARAHAFTRALAETIRDDADIHRLWYDIRSQAMFARFAPVVAEMEAFMQDLLRPFVADHPKSEHDVQVLYAQVDGIFRYLLQRWIVEEELGIDEMQTILATPLGRPD